MKVTLINPNLIVQKNDPLTTGIVYMPFMLAYLAGSFVREFYDVNVIDSFGERPKQVRSKGNFEFHGLTEEEIVARIKPNSQAIFVYAINLMSHDSTISIVEAVKKAFPKIPLVVLENSQAVTAYALTEQVAKAFFDVGANYVLRGEAEHRAVELIKLLFCCAVKEESLFELHMNGLSTPERYVPSKETIADLDSLAYPAWELFPLKNYWDLKFAHGPLSSDKYLPLLTSRGCPYPCKFCVVPETNHQRWRARSAQSVIDEMQFMVAKYGVREFHIEDLDPTISDERIHELCYALINHSNKVVWKIVSGTKVETMRSEKTIELMAMAGCRFISISPETGSKRLLKEMRKPFDLDHAVKLVKKMNEVGIRSQACFVLGYPTENDEDRSKTWALVKDLTKKGIDEIALFIITPVPGSAIYQEFSGFQSLSELNFTPTWREDYAVLSRFRKRLYAMFLIWKLIYHPLKILVQPLNFLRRTFQTKMEMVPYRALVWKWTALWAIPINDELVKPIEQPAASH